MDKKGGVERGAADGPVPDPFVDLCPPHHRLKRDVAERMVEKVKREIREHHAPAREPKAANGILIAQHGDDLAPVRPVLEWSAAGDPGNRRRAHWLKRRQRASNAT